MPSTFRIGEWRVEPQCRLIHRGRETRRLEPKSMAVLCALAEARGEPVSRDGLVQAAWAGRVVSDDAVTRQVIKLRRALGDDPRHPHFIETIPKTGFRLLAPVQLLEESAGGPKRRWPGVVGAVAGAALVAAFASAAFVAIDGAQHGAERRLAQITAAPGMEVHPDPSPSGRAVVYAAKAPDREDYDLFVHDVDDGAPSRLSDEPGDALHPAWSPDGERIAYLAVDDAGCEIRLRVLYRAGDRRLAGCREAEQGGGLSWSPDARWLYFADRQADAPFSLRRVDAESGETARVLEPVTGSIGDTTPRVSSDGRIAFLRVRTLGVEDLFVLGPEEQPRRVTFEQGKIHGLTWLGDDLVMASNRRGGLFALWRVQPETLALEPIAAPLGADGPRGTADGRTLVFEQRSGRVDLWSAPLAGGEPAPVLGSTRWDWWPALSPDGRRLAWTSDRSGAAELWVSDADGGSPRRLTRFQGPYTQATSWSPDGDHLVVAAPEDGQFDLFRIGVADGRIERLTETPQNETAPVFAPDGGLLYRRDGEDGAALVDRRGSVLVRGARRAQFAPDGTLWFAKTTEPGLWRVTDAAPERVTDALYHVDWRNWWVDADGTYLVVRRDPDRPELAKLDPATGELTVLRELPDMLYRSGLQRHGDAVIYARTMQREADLYGIEFGPGR